MTPSWAAASWSDCMRTIRPCAAVGRMEKPSLCSTLAIIGPRSSTTAPSSAVSAPESSPSSRRRRLECATRFASSQRVCAAEESRKESVALTAAWRARPMTGATSPSRRGGSALSIWAWILGSSKMVLTMRVERASRTSSSWSICELASTQRSVSRAWRLTQIVSDEASRRTRASPTAVQTMMLRLVGVSTGCLLA